MNSRSRRGLTFLEVTLVVLIIGLLTAIGTPHFAKSARNRSTRNAAIQIANYVEYVRDVAINEGRTTTISVDAAADRFLSPDVAFPDRIGTPISIDIKAIHDPSLELSASFDSQTTLQFDLEGGISASGGAMTSGVITIRSPELTYEVRIDAGTGATTVVEAGKDGPTQQEAVSQSMSVST